MKVSAFNNINYPAFKSEHSSPKAYIHDGEDYKLITTEQLYEKCKKMNTHHTVLISRLQIQN